jgi:hypothetical protein
MLSRAAPARPSPPEAFPASSPAWKKPISLDLVAEEGIDQFFRLPGEPEDHPDPQTLGEGQEAAVEAAAEQDADSGGREALQALCPGCFGDGQPADTASLGSVQFDDQESIRRAESRSHVIAVKRHGQHLQVLLARVYMQVLCQIKKSY